MPLTESKQRKMRGNEELCFTHVEIYMSARKILVIHSRELKG